jgi:hypothetical protein
MPQWVKNYCYTTLFKMPHEYLKISLEINVEDLEIKPQPHHLVGTELQ